MKLFILLIVSALSLEEDSPRVKRNKLLTTSRDGSAFNVNGNLYVRKDQTIVGVLSIGAMTNVEAYIKNIEERLEVFTFGCDFNNHFVTDHECYDCPIGSKNAAFVLKYGSNTKCACPKGWHVFDAECHRCLIGTRPAGDDPEGGSNTECINA